MIFHLLAVSFRGTLFGRVGFIGSLESATMGLQISDEYATSDTVRSRFEIEYSPTRFERDPFAELSANNFAWSRLVGDLSVSPWNGTMFQFRIPLIGPVALLGFVTTLIAQRRTRRSTATTYRGT